MQELGASRWVSPTVILVATDLSDLDLFMPLALQQAHDTGARLILMHALSRGAGLASDAAGMPCYDPSGAIDFASKTLEHWLATARAQGVACDALVREGNPAHQIISSIRQFSVDRILMGTRSRSKISKLLLGSVAEQVLRSVNIPVITVGPEAHLGAAGSNGSERVVLHATTLRETSSPSAVLACRIAGSQKAKLVLLHVLPPIDELERSSLATDLDSAAMHQLRALAAEIGAGEVECTAQLEARVAHGNPSIEILAAAAELKASLIVLGATHRSAFQNLTRDHTIYQVLAHARCPVMTLRELSADSASAFHETVALHL